MDTKSNTWLSEYGRNVTSSSNEDGIIEKIFEVIGEKSRWCVELGALNGKHDSNVWNLIKNKQWSAVLIEADITYFKKLQDEFKGNEKVVGVNQFVSFEGDSSLDAIFAQTPIPKEFDLFSLDIDGNDYHLWDSMTNYSPRVMIVEFNPTIPNDVDFVQPRNMAIHQGSSLKSLVALGKKKGYELVAVTHPNAIFVKKELFPLFGIADNSIETLHTDHRFETKLFQLYDGTLMLSGYDKLLWHNMKIDPAKLQVLSKTRRYYPAKINPAGTIRYVKYLVRKMPLYTIIQKVRKSIRR
jgi:hypothetical protein